MSRIPSTTSTTTTTGNKTAASAVNDLDLDSFLRLMIKELQNQDPLNPLDNKDMLAQISQIRQVGATDKLTETLDSVLLGQNIASSTNLIGADVKALSDDNERIEGVVSRVSIDQGQPKLHVDLQSEAVGTSSDGEIEAGTHAYRIVWQDNQGRSFGIDLSGNQAVETTGTPGIDQAIQIRNLPKNGFEKRVYRTDASGQGPYRLVGILTNGNQGSFTDVLSDAERSETRLTESFYRSTDTTRSYQVSLKNVSDIRPPARSTSSDDQASEEEARRAAFSPDPRPPFAAQSTDETI